MDLRDSPSELVNENSKSNGSSNSKGDAGSDACRPGCLFDAKLIVSYGELAGKQFHMLRHPKTGCATVYAFGHNTLEELLKFNDRFRSSLLDEHVVRNGSLTFLVPVNPVLFLLPYLRKYAKNDYVPLGNILVDDVFPAIRLLENNETLKSSLKHACYCKKVSNVETYKYSEPLLIDYITDKLKLMEKTDRHKSSFHRVACGILEENLPTDILKLIKSDVSREGNENLLVNNCCKQNLKADNDENSAAGCVLKSVQDLPVSGVPAKRRRLIGRKASF